MPDRESSLLPATERVEELAVITAIIPGEDGGPEI
jgi:hypothetical protein